MSNEVILIVDDEPMNRELLGDIIEMQGFEPIFAESGSEALRKLDADVAVILLDVMMPHMDGFEVTRRIRSGTHCHDVPIILVTALSGRDDRLKGVESGASDYIAKPIDRTELCIRLGAQVKMWRTQRALAEAREQEVRTAVEIQKSLLFASPPSGLDGVCIAALSDSSQAVDGDFYHFFDYGGGRLDIVVGDVMGKGTPAALLGAAAKSTIQEAISRAILECGSDVPSLVSIVGKINPKLSQQLLNLDTFITLAYTRVDLQTNQFRLVDCGHTNILHYHGPKKACTLLRGDDLPLGVSKREIYMELAIPMESGDVFLIYSDGLTEAENSEGEMYGTQRLGEAIVNCAEQEPGAMLRSIVSEIQRFSGRIHQLDDMTGVVVKIGDLPPKRRAAHVRTNSVADRAQIVREAVNSFCCETAGMDDVDASAIVLAVHEAFVNVVKHGYENRPDGSIELDLEFDGEKVYLILSDYGKAFEPDGVPPPDFNGMRPNGFGLFIIKECMDDVLYAREPDGRNLCTMIRRVAKSKE